MIGQEIPNFWTLVGKHGYLELKNAHAPSDIWEYYVFKKIPLIGLYIRIRIGYKLDNSLHIKHLKAIGFPVEFVSSIGLRRNDVR